MTNHINNVPEFLIQLNNWGLTEAILPFILIFTMIFAVLQKTKIIGEGKRQFNSLVALIMALMVIMPQYTGRGPNIVPIINDVLPQVSLMVVVILAALLVIGVFAPGVMFGGTAFGTVLGLLSVGAVVYIFGNAAGWWASVGILGFLNNPDTQAIIVIVVVFALVIWFVTREEGGGERMTRFWEALKEPFDGHK